jgi:hypothetical protein
MRAKAFDFRNSAGFYTLEPTIASGDCAGVAFQMAEIMA